MASLLSGAAKAALPTESSPAWEPVVIGATIEATRESINATVLEATGMPGAAAVSGVGGALTVTAGGAGVPVELLPVGERNGSALAGSAEGALAYGRGRAVTMSGAQPGAVVQAVCEWAHRTYPEICLSPDAQSGEPARGSSPSRYVPFRDGLSTDSVGGALQLATGVPATAKMDKGDLRARVERFDRRGVTAFAVFLGVALPAPEAARTSARAAAVGVGTHGDDDEDGGSGGQEVVAALEAASEAAFLRASHAVVLECLHNGFSAARAGGAEGGVGASAGGAAEVSPAAGPRQHSGWRQQAEFLQQLQALAPVVAALTRLQIKSLPLTKKALVRVGRLPPEPLSWAALADLAPATAVWCHGIVVSQAVGVLAVDDAILETNDAGDRERWRSTVAAVDSRAAAMVDAGTMDMHLTPLEAAMHYLPQLHVVLTVLAAPVVAFEVAIVSSELRLYSNAVVVSFMSGGVLILSPGANRVDAALREADEAKTPYFDVRKVYGFVGVALSHALAAELDFKDPEAVLPSFAEGARAHVRELAQLPRGATVARARLDAAVLWLVGLGRAQDHQHALMRRVNPDAVAPITARVSSLRVSMEDGAAEDYACNASLEGAGDHPSRVAAVRVTECELTPNCGGRRRASDVMCPKCCIWAPGAWVCKCGTGHASNQPECWSDHCDGMKPTQAQRLPSARTSPEVKRMQAFYAKRTRREELAFRTPRKV